MKKEFDIIEDIKKCSFKDGDIVCITLRKSLPFTRRKELHDALNSVLPEKVKHLILDPGMGIAVLTEEEKK